MENLVTIILIISGLLFIWTLRRLACGTAAPLFIHGSNSIKLGDPLAENESGQDERKGSRNALLSVSLFLFTAIIGCLAYIIDSPKHTLTLILILMAGIVIYVLARH